MGTSTFGGVLIRGINILGDSTGVIRKAVTSGVPFVENGIRGKGGRVNTA